MNEDANRTEVWLPVSQLVEIERLCRQFEAAWNAGQRPRAEDFLRRIEEPGRSELRKELAAIDAKLRRLALPHALSKKSAAAARSRAG